MTKKDERAVKPKTNQTKSFSNTYIAILIINTIYSELLEIDVELLVRELAATFISCSLPDLVIKEALFCAKPSARGYTKNIHFRVLTVSVG